MNKKHLFVINNYRHAKAAGEQFGINPVVILAQAALETGWGQSDLCRIYNNYFGITSGGRPNEYWNGEVVELAKGSLRFRCYHAPRESFMDYGRLIATSYRTARDMSNHPEAFAREISYSKYISEVNGDDREAYRKSLISISKSIAYLISKEVFHD